MELEASSAAVQIEASPPAAHVEATLDTTGTNPFRLVYNWLLWWLFNYLYALRKVEMEEETGKSTKLMIRLGAVVFVFVFSLYFSFLWEAKNCPGGRGGFARGNGGERCGGGGYNRYSRNNDAPGNENGYGAGEGGDGARRVGGYRGHGGPRRSNEESGDFERPRRDYERHSGTGHGNEFKRDRAGRRN